MKTCIICGRELPENRSNNRKYCSEACRRKVEAQKKKKTISNRANRINVIAQLAYSTYNCKCALCGWQATKDILTYKGRIQYAHGNELHHITPISENGTETPDNIILLCPNHHKQADLGIIDRSYLRQHTKDFSLTEEEILEAKSKCAETIATSIFGD